MKPITIAGGNDGPESFVETKQDNVTTRPQLKRRPGFRLIHLPHAVVVLPLLLAALAAQIAQAQENPGIIEPSAANTNFAKPRPNLIGQVLATHGDLLPVPATVFIATAAPKTGTSTFCPSCYADCVKHSRADAQGNFKIESLDPQLTFQVLAVAKGYKPESISKVDPAQGPVKIELEPIASADAAPDCCLHGRVVDLSGHPIEGAVVEMEGVEMVDGGGSWGSLPGIDPLAVTDTNGEFLITSERPFGMMDVKVSARTFADKSFTRLPVGRQHELMMTGGATITGRVLLEGHPLEGIGVGISGVERQPGVYAGHFGTGTDAEGKFALVNIPPDVDFWIYTGMSSMGKFGAVPIQKIHSGKDGETTDVGDLVTAPAHRLAGRVVLADGNPLPPEVRLFISREEVWDGREITLDTNGNFDTTGIPNEPAGLSARVKGYRVSARNVSMDQLNPFQLVGRIDRDITNLVFMLEKGGDLPPSYDDSTPVSELPGNLPLRGAEAGVDHSHELTITGRVTDRQTGKPLAHFGVTPGSADLTWQRNAWAVTKAADGSNGIYLVYLDKKWSQPILKVTAAGYLPASILLRPLEQTNADLALERGVGPSGTVVTPGGEPVAKAEVLLICADSHQPGFDFEGHLYSRQNNELLTRADASGHFALAPQLGMRSIVVAASNGFANASMETLATNSTIVLEPYGIIKGILNRPTGPGTNEDLDLAFADDDTSIYQRINLSNHAVTGATGHFEFNRVPAGQLKISYRLTLSGQNGWQNIPLQQVNLRPGQTLEVNIIAPSRKLPDGLGGQPTPGPARVPGVKIEGMVFLPNGNPAAGAQVAVQATGKILALGKATFNNYQAWQEGCIVRAGPDGKFSLPMYAGAKSVIALDEDGYVQVALADLRASPRITLQPWGRIEGTLRLGRHPATNTLVLLSQQPRIPDSIRTSGHGVTNKLIFTNSTPESLEPPIYDYDKFQARTDDQGRFIITYVPPGQQTIARLVPMGNGAQRHQPVGTVLVQPGEVVRVQFGGGERTVTGKVVFADADAPKDLSQAMAMLQSGFTFKMIQRAQQAKTQEERMALFQSEDYRKALGKAHSYSVKLAADHCFVLEGVAPGDYEFGVQLLDENDIAHATSTTYFTSPRAVVVPKAVDTNDDRSVDLGTIELKMLTLPAIPSGPAAK